MPALRVEGLEVVYPNGVAAVRGLDLEVPAGEVFGLVGPNGAGKSSLLNAIAGLVPPSAGSVRCDGEAITGDARAAARLVCLMPDPLGVYNDLTAAEYLGFFAAAFGFSAATAKARIDAAVEHTGLGPWLHYEVETLSAGWQRRLALARSLLSGAPILLLDEPAAGLDMRARGALLDMVRGIAAEGRAVLITSHILPELEELADRFGIMRDGRWCALPSGATFFTRTELAANFGRPRWRLLCSNPAAAGALLGRTADVPAGDALESEFEGPEQAADFLARVVAAGVRVYGFTKISAGLNRLTLDLVGADVPPRLQRP